MKAELSEFQKEVIRLIRAVPKGKVASYGQIAQLAGRDNGSRAVCQVLAKHGSAHKLPWFRIINSQGKIAFAVGSKHFKKQKRYLEGEGVELTKSGRVDFSRFQWKPKVKKKPAMAESLATSIEDVTKNLSEDFFDAWKKLESFALELGDQRVYASPKAIMFARDVCYMFVRPKKSYLELVFFLNREFEHPLLKKPYSVSKTKWGYVMRVGHADHIEEPLTEWLREAFEDVSLKSAPQRSE